MFSPQNITDIQIAPINWVTSLHVSTKPRHHVVGLLNVNKEWDKCRNLTNSYAEVIRKSQI